MEEENKKWFDNGFVIVGLNLGVFSIYSLVLVYPGRNIIGGVLDAFFLFFYFLLCLLGATGQRKWSWLLSGLLILLIGISVCGNYDYIHGDIPNVK